jgi:hypothetical protein
VSGFLDTVSVRRVKKAKAEPPRMRHLARSRTSNLRTRRRIAGAKEMPFVINGQKALI